MIRISRRVVPTRDEVFDVCYNIYINIFLLLCARRKNVFATCHVDVHWRIRNRVSNPWHNRCLPNEPETFGDGGTLMGVKNTLWGREFCKFLDHSAGMMVSVLKYQSTMR